MNIILRFATENPKLALLRQLDFPAPLRCCSNLPYATLHTSYARVSENTPAAFGRGGLVGLTFSLNNVIFAYEQKEEFLMFIQDLAAAGVIFSLILLEARWGWAEPEVRRLHAAARATLKMSPSDTESADSLTHLYFTAVVGIPLVFSLVVVAIALTIGATFAGYLLTAWLALALATEMGIVHLLLYRLRKVLDAS